MRKVFRISRSASEWSPVHVVHVTDGVHIGRGECGELPYAGDTPQSVEAGILEIAASLNDCGTPERLHAAFPASSARNAVDAALWDLACKRQGRSIWDLTGVAHRPSLEIDFTIGIADLDEMCRSAAALREQGYREIKIKVDARDVVATVSAIAAAAPGAKFIVDANEAWSFEQLQDVAPRLSTLGVVLIEQPLHRDADHALEGWKSPVALFADESCDTCDDIARLAPRYDGFNIKLDKCGGLTEALAIVRAARARGKGLMVGCAGATSLGLAPAYVVGTLCDHRDLDSAGMHFDDRTAGMAYEHGEIRSFTSALWG
ncbi:dipeptide epimerase [Rubrivivax albus]|nr:dipeptide epimerase [Rubrivivax albus]